MVDAGAGTRAEDKKAEGRNRDRFGLVGTTLEGKFRIERDVAEGGFAVVYQGNHLTLDRPVAVKVLKTPPEFNDEARAAFISNFAFEAKTIARISHPAIVQVLDFGASDLPSGDRAPWMVLEWLPGDTLDQELRGRRGRGGQAPAAALALLRPVFDALAYAHDEGIAHRDIKPGNMILASGRRGASLRLLDFGIAKIMEGEEKAGSGLTRTQNAMQAFSPKYAAPEQIGGSRTGPWTDVHALGLVLTEVLTDLLPYDGRDITARFAEALSPVRPTPLKRSVDVGGWEPVIARAVALIPEQRYATAGEFLAALEEALPRATHVALAPAASQPAAGSGSGGGSTTLSPAAVAAMAQAPTARARRTPMIAAVTACVLVAAALGLRGVYAGHAGTVPPTVHPVRGTGTGTAPGTVPPGGGGVATSAPVAPVAPVAAVVPAAGVQAPVQVPSSVPAPDAGTALAAVPAVAAGEPGGEPPRGGHGGRHRGRRHGPAGGDPGTASSYTVE